MKILFLLHSYYKYNQGGAEFQIKYIADYLNNKGFDIHYLFLHSQEINIIDDNIQLHTIIKNRLGEVFFGKFFYYKKVLKKLQSIKPDVVYHRNLSNFGLATLKYSTFNHVKTFLHLAHIKDVEKVVLFNTQILKNILDSYGKKRILLNFDKIIAQAKYQDETLQRNFNRKVDLILPNMHPSPEEIVQKSNKIKVLWIANLKQWKQPEIFVKLAEEYNGENVEFIIIGRSSEDDISNTIIDKVAHIDNLSYLGELPISEVNKKLAESHIFVNTSLYEGFPNTFIQAWMRKVPVISLHVNPDNVLVENKIGFYSQSFQQMQKDLKILCEDENLRNEMGENAKLYSYKKYSLRNIESIIKLINEG